MAEDMNERVIFPLVSSWNGPSYLLETVRTLLALGIPEENLRFLPTVGHFAVPEISDQDPPGPSYDPQTGRATVYAVVPSEVRPRVTVSVRGETVTRFWEDKNGDLHYGDQILGRLAHFLPPLLDGLPGTDSKKPAIPEEPLERMTRQMAAAYPELLATLPPPAQEDLMLIADEMMALLGPDETGSAAKRRQRAINALHYVADPEARAACRAAFDPVLVKVPNEGILGIPDSDLLAARTRFWDWSALVFAPEAEAGRLEQAAAALSSAQQTQQHAFWRAFQKVVSFETAGERQRIIQEMMEILTTEAFLAVATLDAMNGMAWIHGSLADICLPSPAPPPEGLLLSVTGGRQSRGLLLTLMQTWAASPEGILGVGLASGDAESAGKRPTDREWLNLGMLDEASRLELFSLALWRRESGDVRTLLEMACQRLIHPEIAVHWQLFQDCPSQFGTLLAQPGQTAMLGGAALLFPGLTILMPLAEEADEDAVRAKAILHILTRLFVPVSCRVTTVWQEALARLDGGAFLKHDFQRGARLADAWAALNAQESEE